MKSSLNKKGFTLIELLAVLVVLAILALIGIPIVVNVIDGARISARQRSVDAYGKAAEYAISVAMLEEESSDEEFDAELQAKVDEINADDTLSAEEKEEKINNAVWNKIEPTIDYKGDKIECDVSFERINGSFTLDNCYIGSENNFDEEKVLVTLKDKKTPYTYSSISNKITTEDTTEDITEE